MTKGETKWTKGPYAFDELGGFIMGPNYEHIADIRGFGAELPQKENGQLLAASPAMYEALKLAEKEISECHTTMAMLAKVRQALKAAEEGQ